MSYRVHPIDILHVNDNYVWALTPDNSNFAYVVDPGEAAAVHHWLHEQGLQLGGILVTHGHWDHVTGIPELLNESSVPVWAPALSKVPDISHFVEEGDNIEIEGIKLKVLAIPGHTRDHIAYYTEQGDRPALFCGDTLFAAGCGRVFDGSLPELYQSLRRLAQLPPETLIYCAHEYTQANLRFAAAVEPGNLNIPARLAVVEQRRAQGLPSLPSRMALELETNPFLRCGVAEISARASERAQRHLQSEQEVFDVIRKWKDNFAQR